MSTEPIAAVNSRFAVPPGGRIVGSGSGTSGITKPGTGSGSDCISSRSNATLTEAMPPFNMSVPAMGTITGIGPTGVVPVSAPSIVKETSAGTPTRKV